MHVEGQPVNVGGIFNGRRRQLVDERLLDAVVQVSAVCRCDQFHPDGVTVELSTV